ncbi:MAG: AAA family ATPase [Planktothrix sp.]
MGIDKSQEEFNQLCEELNHLDLFIETEQDARFQIIDRILLILGWNRQEIRTEPHTDSGYVDYLLSVRNRNKFVVEAKRTSKLLIDTYQQKMNWYQADGPALKSAKEGLEQAQRYCSEVGVVFSALTTGKEWIGYWAIRTDGTLPKKGKAIVFPSLKIIQENYAIFYDLFSPEGIKENLYKARIYEAEGNRQINSNEILEPVINLDKRAFLPKSILLRDLETIYGSFFSTISGEDPDMLINCFVESQESKAADESLEKITKNLLNKIDVLNSEKGVELENEIRSAIAYKKGEFVLIIGNKGSGKSTFIDRFFRQTLDKQLRKYCVVLRLDLANSDGNEKNISDWLNKKLKDELETNLFKDKYPTYSDLQGIFFDEYKRWIAGSHKPLYERDKDAFKEQFGYFVYDIISKNPQEYVNKLLNHAISSRKLMPCIVFDNTDHFPQSFQESVFQFAQSIYRECFSFIICPITDRTVWQLSKSGPLQSYEHRDFYLPVPSTKDVLTKRIEFIKLKTQEDSEIYREYFTKKGIRLQIPQMKAFAFSVETIFVTQDYIGRMVGWLANFDIRRGLQIAKQIITSPIIDISELVKAYTLEENFEPDSLNIKKALLLGDYNYFSQRDSSFILNIFEVDNYPTSPLLRLSILQFLRDIYCDQGESDKIYSSVEDILNYFEPTTVSRVIVQKHLNHLLHYRLIEPYDPTDTNIYESQKVKITPCGRIHYEFVTENGGVAYMREMSLTTPIANPDCIFEIRKLVKENEELKEYDLQINLNFNKIIKHFINYCISQDKRYMSIPTNLTTYQAQHKLRDILSQVWLND